MQRRDKVTLKKILIAIDEAAEVFGDVSKENFLTSTALKLSMAMSVIRVGELVKALTSEFRLANPQVPWREIAGFRDVATYEYDTVDMGELYGTIQKDFPELKLQIEKILAEDDNG